MLCPMLPYERRVVDALLTTTDAEWVSAAYSLTFASLLILWGRIADRAGRRLLFESIRRMLSAQIHDVIASTRAALTHHDPQSADDVRSLPPLVCFSPAMAADSAELNVSGNGFVAVPEGPGLGVEIDEDRVRDIAKSGHDWRNPIWRTPDGGFAEW